MIRRRNLSDCTNIRSNVSVVPSEEIARHMMLCSKSRRIIGYSTNTHTVEFDADGIPLTQSQKIEVCCD